MPVITDSERSVRYFQAKQADVLLVTPRTVVEWHRAGFRLYWKWISRAKAVCGRRTVSKEVRELIFRMCVWRIGMGSRSYR